MIGYEKLNWIPIAEKPPPVDWPIFVKGTDSMGFVTYGVLQWHKPSQDGYPGYYSPMCGASAGCRDDDLEIKPTHWLDAP